jgi:hypothetical protein
MVDDFLHNLRSGKLKQADRGNRSYNDPQYKGGPRRGSSMDRRKKEMETFERLNAVKEVLDTISETQKRMAVAYEARTKAEERKARALEVLAKNIYRMINPDADDIEALFAPVPEPVAELEPPAQTETATEAKDAPPEKSPRLTKLSDEDRNVLFGLIVQMRDEGHSWENIARQIATQGYPTTTGRGVWRGITAKNLYEKMTTSNE